MILDARRYFGLYGSVLRMGIDPAPTVWAIHRSSEINWTKTEVQDRFVSNDFKHVGVSDLEEEVVPA